MQRRTRHGGAWQLGGEQEGTSPVAFLSAARRGNEALAGPDRLFASRLLQPCQMYLAPQKLAANGCTLGRDVAVD
eukprot:6430713-Pyramimonas_sp.AAC.1